MALYLGSVGFRDSSGCLLGWSTAVRNSIPLEALRPVDLRLVAVVTSWHHLHLFGLRPMPSPVKKKFDPPLLPSRCSDAAGG